jgi:mannose-6-phosphate isomerase
MMSVRHALLLQPIYREYIWGGKRLRPAAERTAEAWVVYENDRILSGPFSGRSLGEAAVQFGEELLGKRPLAKTGTRFPLLVKLLDCAEWLSLQVHPDDSLARRLEGPGQFGKTEAWHFLEADPGAQILCGVRPGTSAEALAAAIRGGSLVDAMLRLDVRAGESIFIPAGMIHALGPGLLLYEVQQTSDWTYRVYDWDRPASPQRPLHIDKSIAAAKPELSGSLIPLPPDGQACAELIRCDYFTLERLVTGPQALDLAMDGESFHSLTVIAGQAKVEGDGWAYPLERFGSLVIPADAGAYRVSGGTGTVVLKASV